jgi:hypothetical protein
MDVTTLFVLLEEGMEEGDMISLITICGDTADVEYTDINGEEGIVTLVAEKE